MGANDKLAAAMGPLASLVADDTEPDALVGENPCLPARSGAAAVLDACKTIDAATHHTRNLQAAVDDIRALHELETTLCVNCTERFPCSTIAILDRHGV